MPTTPTMSEVFLICESEQLDRFRKAIAGTAKNGVIRLFHWTEASLVDTILTHGLRAPDEKYFPDTREGVFMSVSEPVSGWRPPEDAALVTVGWPVSKVNDLWPDYNDASDMQLPDDLDPKGNPEAAAKILVRRIARKGVAGTSVLVKGVVRPEFIEDIEFVSD